MSYSLRPQPPTVYPTTKLVRQLISFGQDEPEPGSGSAAVSAGAFVPGPVGVEEDEGEGDLDVQDDVRVSGGQATTSSSTTDKLATLSLSSPPAPTPAAPKVPRSLKSLLRSSEHTVTLQTPSGPVERVLTSWKMADYAYKRDPCPFPTRARGLFTERVKGAAEGDEFRIVARGYDKFFNVDEVSWTQVGLAPGLFVGA